MQNGQKTAETLETLTDQELTKVAGGRRGRGAGRSSN
jgi:hypothetical protein